LVGRGWVLVWKIVVKIGKLYSIQIGNLLINLNTIQVNDSCENCCEFELKHTNKTLTSVRKNK
jgi:hypothetical protein